MMEILNFTKCDSGGPLIAHLDKKYTLAGVVSRTRSSKYIYKVFENFFMKSKNFSRSDLNKVVPIVLRYDILEFTSKLPDSCPSSIKITDFLELSIKVFYKRSKFD